MINKHRIFVNGKVRDVVCGMMKPIDQFKFAFDYQGKTYYFCTEQDKQIFKAFPDRWVSDKDEERRK